MERKPWPIIILALLHILEPITKICFYSLFYNLSFSEILTNLYRFSSYWELFEFFCLFPLAGFSILAVKKWSYWVFLIVEVWVLVANLDYFHELYQREEILLLSFFCVFTVCNISAVTYFLLPAVRMAYFDPRIRWWEASPRYQIEESCLVGGEKQGVIKNISKTGIFLADAEGLSIDSVVDLKFKYFDKEFDLEGKIVHQFTIDQTLGFGVQFQGLSLKQKLKLRNLIKEFEKRDIKRRPPRVKTLQDLKNWLVHFIKTGKGAIPEVPHRKKA